MESVRVRLRKKRGRSWEYQEIEIPTDAEMERIAAELHAKRAQAMTTVLGWEVLYTPSKSLRYTTTEVNPFTGESGETSAHAASTLSCCVFGHGMEWQVCYSWNRGDNQPPERIQERGDVVSILSETQQVLFSEDDETGNLFEGAIQQGILNTHERNREARIKCIEHHGSKCLVCGFDFGKTYGDLAEGFIHVHHLTPLSDIRMQHVIDPVKDLRPVCPNCHAVIHMQNPPFTIEEVRRLLVR